MQAMGENIVAAIPAFTQHLNKASDRGSNPNIPLEVPPDQESVYFDFCGIWMISYRVAVGRWLHNLILPLVVLLPPPGVRRGGMVKGMGICLLSMLGGLSMPAGVGALRAVLSGTLLVQLFCSGSGSCFWFWFSLVWYLISGYNLSKLSTYLGPCSAVAVLLFLCIHSRF